MRRTLTVLTLLAGFSTPSSATTITFGLAAPGAIPASGYSEGGFIVKWSSLFGDPLPGLISAGPDLCALCASNGTTYAVGGFFDPFAPIMTITKIGGGTFTFQGFDGGEMPISGPTPVIEVKGLGPGPMYMEIFSPDGFSDGIGGAPDFESFTAATSFFDVFTELSFSGSVFHYGIDNIVLDEAAPAAVPEPASLLLLATGLAVLVRRRRRVR